MIISTDKLKQLLVDKGFITIEQFASAEKTARHLGIDIEEVLTGRGIIAENDLGEIIASYFGTKYVDLKEIEIDQKLFSIIPREMAIERRAIAFELQDNKLLVALENPSNIETVEFIRKKTGYDIIVYFTLPQNITYGLRLYKKGIRELVRILKQIVKTQGRSSEKDLQAQDNSIIRIVNLLLEYAIAENVSDIHIEAVYNGLLVRYRIDGILHDIIILPKSLHESIIARIKIISNLRVDETRLPQDGRFRYKTREGESTSIRVSILPTIEGEKVVMRILESAVQRLSLKSLGLNDQQLKVITSSIKKPYGCILLTGPTGSGKTTTLYTILGILNTPEVNISTIEDPVENRLPRVNQSQVNTAIGLDFASGLRALLRQDPNIIMVGEIRDKETGTIAVNASMTGHLVLSTLHTNDAAGAIPRLINLGIEPFLIASTLNLIIAQRLVRIVCRYCKANYHLNQEMINLLYAYLQADGYPNSVIQSMIPKIYFKGEGCDRCNYTGYKGRTGIHEFLTVTDEIKKLIIAEKSAAEIKHMAIQKGMHTMLISGLFKVRNGITSVEELLRVAAE